VWVREWFDYATTRVPNMQMEKVKKSRGLGVTLSFVGAKNAFQSWSGASRKHRECFTGVNRKDGR